MLCPDNTIHQALPYIEPRSPLAWLHIAGVIAAEAAALGHRHLGLTGTGWLVASEVYSEKLSALGLETVRTSPAERNKIDRIIMNELVCGVIASETLAYFQPVITRMKHRGCDAVILGCTEIPLMINNSNSPLPTLDSTPRSPKLRCTGRSLNKTSMTKLDFREHSSQSIQPLDWLK